MPAAERLQRVSLECKPALDLIAQYGQHPGVLLWSNREINTPSLFDGWPRWLSMQCTDCARLAATPKDRQRGDG